MALGDPVLEVLERSLVSLAEELLRPRDDDLKGLPGYRFWIVVRDMEPVLALEQRGGWAWTRDHAEPLSIMDLYEESRRHLLVAALKLFRRVDHV